MTSVLNVDTIADKAGTGPVALTKQSAAKGWCHANQVSVGITDSYNVSSITDSSTGLIYYTPTNSMSDANYVSSVTVRQSSTGATFAQSLNDLHTTSRWASSSKNSSSVGVDSQHNNIVVHGDLA
jgi:hypothetical protein